MEDKKTLIGLRLVLALSLSLGLVFPAFAETSSRIVGELEQNRDRFQATQWLRLAQEFWETGDYAQLGYFCDLILTYYPDTTYAQQAEKLMKKSANPSQNRSREYIRNNPGIFIK